MIRISSFLANGYSVVRIKDLWLAKRKATADIRQLRAEIDTLKGLFPVCAICKCVREDEWAWRQIEAYRIRHADTDAAFWHCNKCAEKIRLDAVGQTPPVVSEVY